MGKTTFARKFLPKYANCKNFVNADLIAEGISLFRLRLQLSEPVDWRFNSFLSAELPSPSKPRSPVEAI